MESLHGAMAGEIRHDPLSGRTVVVAPGRARRPGAGAPPLAAPSAEELESCPFCEGREDRTPPETLALGRDGRAPDSPGWRVRVVPNLYPAFEHQEVVIHTTGHATSLADLSADDLTVVAEAWRQRAAVARERGFGYVHALVNEGRDAGASLSHTHSQLVWLREPPPVVVAEAGEPCAVCGMLADERGSGTRVVLEREGVVAVCPYAGRSPYELLIAPVAHEPDGFTSPTLPAALFLVADLLRRLTAVEGRRPLNAWLHTGSHWHLEVVPRVTVLAGVELGAGIFVNTLAPEEAAQRLRDAAT